jgi:hypothetical protein
MIAHLPNLDAIFKRHWIHPKFWPEFRGLVEEGRRPGKALRTRLHHVANYKAALNEIAAELSKGLEHEFPPADYQPPADYPFYESLTPEDIAIVTSPGCAV